MKIASVSGCTLTWFRKYKVRTSAMELSQKSALSIIADFLSFPYFGSKIEPSFFPHTADLSTNPSLHSFIGGDIVEVLIRIIVKAEIPRFICYSNGF